MTNKESFQAAVKAQINGDANHSWGIEDSLAVIMAVVANENGSEAKDYDDSFKALVRAVINPSQFRQKLEGTAEEIAAGKALLLKGTKTRKSSSDILEGLI